jgi:DNA-directed RNA polymerase III subunit RPC3
VRARDCDALTPALPIPLLQKVCGCLLRHGPLSLQEIVRRLGLSSGQVKNSLLVLIQHNCVQAYSTPRGKLVRETLDLSILI